MQTTVYSMLPLLLIDTNEIQSWFCFWSEMKWRFKNSKQSFDMTWI